jgi:hypothetical protein
MACEAVLGEKAVGPFWLEVWVGPLGDQLVWVAAIMLSVQL